MVKNRSATADIGAWIATQPKTQRASMRAALGELRKLFKSRQHDSLLWWHQVGEQILILQPTGQRRYGDNVVGLLADHLDAGGGQKDRQTANLLYRTRDFAEKYTRQEARQLEADRKGGRLTRSHVAALLSLDDQQKGRSLLQQCKNEGWSAQRLWREVQNEAGRKRSSGGLSPTPPENPTPGVALRDIAVLAKRWMACHDVWFAKKKAALKRIPVKDRSEAMLEELERAKDGLTDVKKAVAEELAQLKSLTREVQGTIRSGSRGRGGRKR